MRYQRSRAVVPVQPTYLRLQKQLDRLHSVVMYIASGIKIVMIFLELLERGQRRRLMVSRTISYV